MDNNEKVLFDEVCVNANESDIGTNAIVGGGWCGGLLCGGVLHNVGQILMACALMGRNVAYYLPVLILSGVGAGIAIGVLAADRKSVV